MAFDHKNDRLNELSHATREYRKVESKSTEEMIKEVLRVCDFSNSINLVACAPNNENECAMKYNIKS